MIQDLTRVHYKQLDGLRGIAVLMVMFYHFGLLHPDSQGADPGLLLQAFHFGWMGVDLFFVLSGFLITGILLATRSQEHYFRNFLARRFLRIWPLYYLNLAMFFLVIPAVLSAVPSELQSMIDKQGWFWLYGANWLYALEGGFNRTSGGYFWSLAVEEQFYLLWPVVVYTLSSRALLRVALGLLVFSFFSRLTLVGFGMNTNSVYTMTFTHLDGLAVGVILAICSQSKDLAAVVLRISPWVLGGALIVLAAIVVADGNAFFWSHNMAVYGYSTVACLFGVLLLYSLRPAATSIWSRLLQTRFLVAAGKYSYALYMVHVPVAAVITNKLLTLLSFLDEVVPYAGKFTTAVVANFLISWSLAVLSWHFFEKRVLALKKRFEYKETAVKNAQPLASQT